MTRRSDGEGFTAVIGGGGAMAIGISAGILMALKDAGLDVADAAATIGTSAGSTVAADIQLGVPLDEIAARVCTDRADDGPSGESRTTGDDPCMAHLARTRPAGHRVDLGADAGMSPVRVPLPEPPGILRRQFPRCVARRSANRTTGPSEFYPEEWPERRICAVASDLDSGQRVLLEADPSNGTPRGDLAASAAGVVCDSGALSTGARRRCPARRRWDSLSVQSRPGGPAAVTGRPGDQLDHVRSGRSAEWPGPSVAHVAEPHGPARGGVPSAPRPRGAAAPSRDASPSNSPAPRCSPDASPATSSRPPTRARHNA